MTLTNFKDYQEQAYKTAVFPAKVADEYVRIALFGELGEACNKYKKVLRGDKPLDEMKNSILAECGGIFWYVAALATLSNIELDIQLPKEEQSYMAGDTLSGLFLDAIKSASSLLFVDKPSALTLELEDLLDVLFEIVIRLGSTPAIVLQQNLDILASRQERGTLKGSGDNR